MSDYTWIPTDDYIERANVTRLGRRWGIASIDELRVRSVEDIGWYWDSVVADLGLRFHAPYTSVVDSTRGIARADWFVDGTLNIVDSCVARWLHDPATADRVAVVHVSEAGTVRSLTYRELAQEVELASAGLHALGVGSGDPVALFLPMVPEAVIAYYALARIGAIVVPLFSGFAPYAISARLQDADAKAVIVADGTVRRGRRIDMHASLQEALRTCPSVEHVVVVGNLGEIVSAVPGETTWTELCSPDTAPVPTKYVGSSDTLLLAYTSGTTGKPKGAVHTHAGFLAKTASEVAYSFDLGPGGVFCWITDLGWIMGPLSITGTHANGGTLLMYEGSPDHPDADQLWRLAEKYRVTMLGVSPSLIRAVRSSPTDIARSFDLSAVHVLGSTGEPWDPDAYDWLARDVFGGRVPVINFSGGTEVGGSFLAPYPVEPIPSCSLGGPSLGMDVDVVDDDGQPVRGCVGELVCRQPWPSMTRGVWKDDERFAEAYWSTFPGMWRHGDYALVEGSRWYVRGRSDDVMNVAGKRLASAEVEDVLTRHPDVLEAAAVGVPDDKKGEKVWVFWVARPGVTEDLSDELRGMVSTALGKAFAPSRVVRVPSLPKTISGKIIRRAVRAASLGTDPGDMTGTDNPGAVEEIRLIIEAGI